MKILAHLLKLTSAACALSAPARAELIEQFTLPPRDCTPCVWFQGGPAAAAGVLSLGNMPIGPTLFGGWLTFTPEGTFVSYMGGGSTHEVLSPLGEPLTDVRGASKLAEAYGVIVDTTSGTITVTSCLHFGSNSSITQQVRVADATGKISNTLATRVPNPGLPLQPSGPDTAPRDRLQHAD